MRQVLGQLVFTLAVILFFWWMGSTAATELADRGLVPAFNFLDLRAGFAISESPEQCTSDSTYGQAFVVGMINTLRIVVFGLVLSSVVGLFVGVFLLSSNWLIRSIARAYVEALRNTPLLVQIFAWYFIVMFSLPRIQDAITFPAKGSRTSVCGWRCGRCCGWRSGAIVVGRRLAWSDGGCSIMASPRWY